MPERKDSIDSFDEFFGGLKNEDDTRRRASIKPKQNDTAISEIVKHQPITQRPKTPPTPEQRRSPSSKPKCKCYYYYYYCYELQINKKHYLFYYFLSVKVNNTKTTNGRRNSSAQISIKADSIKSKEDYESGLR